MERSTLCNSSLFYCRNGRWTFTFPFPSSQTSNPSLPITTQSRRCSVESKGPGHEGGLAAMAWGLANVTGLLAWPQLHAHPCSRPSPGRWNFLADGLQGYFGVPTHQRSPLVNSRIGAINTKLTLVGVRGFCLPRRYRGFFGCVWLFSLK